MNLFAAFAETVARRRYHPAIFWGEAQLAYDWVAQRTAWLSRALTRDFGIQRGDRVAVWLKNCPEFPAAIFGVWRAGGVVTVINNFLKPEEVAFILADSGARIVITDGSLAENQAKLAALGPGLKFLRVEDFAALAEADAPLPADLNEADLAALLYTSGTTGRPKGAMLTHGTSAVVSPASISTRRTGCSCCCHSSTASCSPSARSRRCSRARASCW